MDEGQLGFRQQHGSCRNHECIHTLLNATHQNEEFQLKETSCLPIAIPLGILSNIKNVLDIHYVFFSE